VRVRKRTKYIIVHHSASPRTTTKAEIEQWHKKKGWEAIGYHFVVEGDGMVVRSRDVHMVGSHTLGGRNDDSIGVCVVGDNTRLEHVWYIDQIVSLRVLIQEAQRIYGPLAVYGHRDAPGLPEPTLCPGINIQAVL